MAKVRILEGDDAGTVGYMGYPEIQAALKSNPEALEILDGNAENENPDLRQEGNLADALERGEVRRSPVAARDLSEEVDPTVVTTEGHGVAGPDALRIGPSVTHRSEPLPITTAGAPGPAGDPTQAVRDSSQERADEQNQRADEARASSEKAAASREGEAAAGAPSAAAPGPSDTSPEAAPPEEVKRRPGRPPRGRE